MQTKLKKLYPKVICVLDACQSIGQVNIDVQKYGYYDFKKQEWVEPHTLYNFNVYEHPKKWRKKWRKK